MPHQDPVSLNKLDARLLEIPTIFLPLTEKETAGIRENIGQVDADTPAMVSLAQKIDAIIEKEYPEGCFIKMVSRSPKDSYLGSKISLLCGNGKEALNLLCDSERISDDTYMFNPEFSCLALRQWIDMSSMLEFRLFVKDGALQGASQYFYCNFLKEIVEHKDFFWERIKEKFESIKEYLPQEDLIVDLFWDEDRMLVIECNPYNRDTDPCLFSWDSEIEGFRVLEVPPAKVDWEEKSLEFFSQKP